MTASSAANGEDEDIYANKSLGVYGYSVILMITAGVIAAGSVALISSWGIGVRVFRWLIDVGYAWQQVPLGIAVVIFTVLYMLDFFWPPHMPKKHFRLWKGDVCVGKSILGFGMLMFVVAGLFMAKDYPSVPVVFALVAEPAVIALLRWATKPHAFTIKNEEALDKDVQAKLMALKKITGNEKDTLAFLKACLIAFSTISIVSIAAWIYVAITDGGPHALQKENDITWAVAFLIWVTPLLIGIGNFVFGLYVCLRMAMQNTYADTDAARNELIMNAASDPNFNGSKSLTNTLVEELARHRVDLKQAESGVSVGDDEETMRRKYEQQGGNHVKQLTILAKIIGMVFVVVLGACYVTFQLASVDAAISATILGLLGTFFAMFVIFFYFMFKRIAEAMGKWLHDLPAFKAANKLRQNDWVRACFICCFLPVFPFIFCLGAVNQCIRKCRGIYKYGGAEANDWDNYGGKTDIDALPDTLWCTPRTSLIFTRVRKWNTISIAQKATMLCLLMFCFYISPIFINIVFSWMRYIFMGAGDPEAAFGFGWILFITFWVGVTAFLLPPVPGLTVYIFGGLMVSGACPEEFGGFWGGSVINIFLCWFLKLTACAVQQKVIGENLGRTQSVRSFLGVHTMQCRTIEKLLRTPGLSIGKVALLCGGPDWPVSVTAGILKLSLYQCELGTLPILFFIIPCAMTGSFYLKMGGTVDMSSTPEQQLAALEEQQMWDNCGKMMVVVTMGVTLILWAILTWALQNILEQNYEELSIPLTQNVELHWIDHRNEEVKKRCSVDWPRVPGLMRCLLLASTFIHKICCQAIYWGKAYLFGTFAVQSDITDLIFYGEPPEAVIGRESVVLFALYVVGWLGLIAFSFWKSAYTRSSRLEVLKELAVSEPSWKEVWIVETTAKLEEFERRKDGLNTGGANLADDAEEGIEADKIGDSKDEGQQDVRDCIIPGRASSPVQVLGEDCAKVADTPIAARETDSDAPTTACEILAGESANAAFQNQDSAPCIETLQSERSDRREGPGLGQGLRSEGVFARCCCP